MKNDDKNITEFIKKQIDYAYNVFYLYIYIVFKSNSII